MRKTREGKLFSYLLLVLYKRWIKYDCEFLQVYPPRNFDSTSTMTVLVLARGSSQKKIWNFSNYDTTDCDRRQSLIVEGQLLGFIHRRSDDHGSPWWISRLLPSNVLEHLQLLVPRSAVLSHEAVHLQFICTLKSLSLHAKFCLRSSQTWCDRDCHKHLRSIQCIYLALSLLHNWFTLPSTFFLSFPTCVG